MRKILIILLSILSINSAKSEIGITVSGGGSLWTDEGSNGISYDATDQKTVLIDGVSNSNYIFQIQTAEHPAGGFTIEDDSTVTIGNPTTVPQIQLYADNNVFSTSRIFFDGGTAALIGRNTVADSESTLTFHYNGSGGYFSLKAEDTNSTVPPGTSIIKGVDANSSGVNTNGGHIVIQGGDKQSGSGGSNGSICLRTNTPQVVGVTIDGDLWSNGNFTQLVHTDDVSNPPTDTELDTIFGTPATVGSGFNAYIDDNGGGANFYKIVSDGSNWWIFTGTQAL